MRRDALAGGGPGRLEHGPGSTQALRIARAALLAPREAAVQLGLHERDDVDAVDHQGALAVEEPRSVDVRAAHVHRAHDGAGEVGPDEPGSAEVDVDERGARLVPCRVIGCHGCPFRASGWTGQNKTVAKDPCSTKPTARYDLRAAVL